MKNSELKKINIDKKLFWDADLKNIDLNKHAEYIIKRVLNFGDLSDFNAIIDLYGKEKVKNVAKNTIFQNNKTLNFYQKIFKIKCIQKQSKKIQSAFSKRSEK